MTSLVRELRQSDFSHGTVRLLSGQTCRLVENILVHFQPESDFGPTEAQWAAGTFDRQATQLGFTTAIQIDGHDVVLDLQGFTLEQSPEYALQQRFFSLVQLGPTPFIDAAGPVDFVTGTEYRGPIRVTIRNGTLGRSSHHGIQGNDASNVLIEDIVFRDYEVAAISLNQAQDVDIRDCHLAGQRIDIPVRAAYSQARFLRAFVRKVLTHPDAPAEVVAEGTAQLSALETTLDQVRDEVLHEGRTMHPLFANPSGLLDGSVYGVLVHGRGPAVNDLAINSDDTSGFSRRIRLSNVTVDTVRSAPRSVLGLSVLATATAAPGAARYAPGVQHDCAGAVLDLGACWDPLTDRYVPNVLADLQGFLCAFQEWLPALDRARLTLSPGVVRWLRVPGTLLADVMAEEQLYALRGGDSMFHVMKGVLGLRFDHVEDLQLQQVRVQNVENLAEPEGLPTTGVLGTTNLWRFHPNQTQVGFQGCMARGVCFSGCQSVSCHDLVIDGVLSANGDAIGQEVLSPALLQVQGGSIERVVAPRGLALAHRSQTTPESDEPRIPGGGCPFLLGRSRRPRRHRRNHRASSSSSSSSDSSDENPGSSVSSPDSPPLVAHVHPPSRPLELPLPTQVRFVDRQLHERAHRPLASKTNRTTTLVVLWLVAMLLLAALLRFWVRRRHRLASAASASDE